MVNKYDMSVTLNRLIKMIVLVEIYDKSVTLDRLIKMIVQVEF